MSISSGKEGTGSPWRSVAIEIHKILPLDTPNQVPIEDKILSDHVFDILEHSS